MKNSSRLDVVQANDMSRNQSPKEKSSDPEWPVDLAAKLGKSWSASKPAGTDKAAAHHIGYAANASAMTTMIQKISGSYGYRFTLLQNTSNFDTPQNSFKNILEALESATEYYSELYRETYSENSEEQNESESADDSVQEQSADAEDEGSSDSTEED